MSQGHSELQNCREEKSVDIVPLFSDTATSVQPFAEKQAFLWNCLACAHCESRFAERIYRTFYIGIPLTLGNGGVLV